MALAQAILACIADCPCTGYDLAKRFDGSVGFFWKATHQQIYRELAKIEEQGWIVGETILQENRPDKKRYSLTESGSNHLVQWITEPTELLVIKEDLLVKLFSGHLVPPELLIAELQRHQQSHAERLGVYQTLEQQFFANPQSLSLKGTCSYLTLRKGIRYESDYVSWCEEAIDLLKETKTSTTSSFVRES